MRFLLLELKLLVKHYRVVSNCVPKGRFEIALASYFYAE